MAIRGRGLVLVGLVVGAVVLAVATAAAGPAPNDRVYGWEVVVADVRVEGALADDVVVHAPDPAEAREAGLRWVGAVALIVTPEVPVMVTAPGSDLPDGPDGVDVSVREAPVDVVPGDHLVGLVEAGIPTFVEVALPEPSLDATPPSGMTRPEPTTVTLSLEAVDAPDGGRRSDLVVRIDVHDVTGEDRGIPGRTDVADVRLPRPAAGEALPERLADGHPVWVVGLDDGEVVVLDARSPHTPSGLVGWCPAMPGFTDSPGAARFDARGRYRFGPAPTGLAPYEAEVVGDHVVVTASLAPPGRPTESVDPRYEPIEALGPAGPGCTPDGGWENSYDPTTGTYEDYTGSNPGWRQHDPTTWPALDGQADGWYHADRAEAPDVGCRRGELLVRRERGRTVDVAAPPGLTSRCPPTTTPAPQVGLLVDVVAADDPSCGQPCPAGGVGVRGVVWVTPDAVMPVTVEGDRPSAPAVLVGDLPYTTPPPVLPLAREGVVDAAVGDLVVVERDVEGQVVAARRLS